MSDSTTTQRLSQTNRLELVKIYLSTFQASGNIPDHKRMLQDLRELSAFVYGGD